MSASSRRDGVSFDYIATLVGRETAGELLALVGDPDAIDVALAQPGAPGIDFVTAWKMLNANITLGRDETHRLGATPVPNGNFELLMASMLQGENLADGLRRLAAGAQVVRPDLIITVSLRNGTLTLGIALQDSNTAAAMIYAEALLLVVHCALLWATGRRVVPLRVRGPQALAGFHCSVLDLTGVPVQRHGEMAQITYAAATELSFEVDAFQRWHEAAFAEYVRLAERRLVATPARVESAPELIAQVRDSLLGNGASQAMVARRLGMSVATLRRRLAENGQSFRGIASDLRRDTAQILLLGDKSTADIAEELGLSDSRCFRRACHGWFGQPPSAVRRTMRQAAT